MLPPSMALSLFIFAMLTLIIGICFGWAWGCAAMAAGLRARDQVLLQQQITTTRSGYASAILNPDLVAKMPDLTPMQTSTLSVGSPRDSRQQRALTSRSSSHLPRKFLGSKVFHSIRGLLVCRDVFFGITTGTQTEIVCHPLGMLRQADEQNSHGHLWNHNYGQ